MKKAEITKISDEEYFSLSFVNASTLKELYRKSPKHYQASQDYPEPEPRVFTLGSAIHCLCLETEEFDKRYTIIPDFQPTDGKEYKNFKATKNYKEQLEAWEKENDKIVLTNEEYLMCREIYGAYLTSPYHEMCSRGAAEVTVLASVRGVDAKAKLDLLIDLGEEIVIIDLKTTKDASQEAFIKSVFNYDYDLAAAWYVDALKAIPDYSSKTVRFMWLAVEKQPPFSACMYEADNDVLQNGRAKYSKALVKYKEWVALGGQRGYDAESEVQLIKVPNWGRA